ncbi:MAG: hypothetical protein KZQ70_14685, partial [gamma proteobacterium symbiont of Lucinoma myriamae]|nr:hypothetical protein [gamma proteobacterium symbiont of Lucinoma myriamae]
SLRLVNRPLRTRMMGGVGAVGEKPVATRLILCLLYPVLGRVETCFVLKLILYNSSFFIIK